MTPKALSELDYALVVAVGEKKRWAITNAFKKDNSEDLDRYPAALLQNIKLVEMFTNIKI